MGGRAGLQEDACLANSLNTELGCTGKNEARIAPTARHPPTSTPALESAVHLKLGARSSHAWSRVTAVTLRVMTPPGGEPGGRSSRVLCPEPPAPTPRLRGLGASHPRPAGIGSTSSGWHRLCPGPAKCGRLAWPWPAVAEVEGPLSPRARSCGGVTGAGQALASGRGLPQGSQGAPFTYRPGLLLRWPQKSEEGFIRVCRGL